MKANFGFKKVDKKAKQALVQGVFSSVASNYDLMNDFMSFGLHRLWKNEFIKEIKPHGEEILLDVAGGTGDIATRFIEKGGKKAIVCDLNKEMLAAGIAKNKHPNISFVHANAEDLPFADNSFEFYSISFGIRNVTNIDKALREAHRVLKPGGKFACLEFSDVSNDVIRSIYNFYSFNIIPKIGQHVAGDGDAYKYLVESIRNFPEAPLFESMICDAGFKHTEFTKLNFGVVAIHTGYKI